MTDHLIKSDPVIFQPDSLVAEHLIDMLIGGKLNDTLYQIVLTDLKTGQQQIVLVEWEDGTLRDLTVEIYETFSRGNDNEALEETFFWLFWRGWAGILESKVIADLPNADPELLAILDEQRPLRGDLLRKLRATIIWAYAGAAGSWGDREMWKTGELAPGHITLRNTMGTFIEERMKALHGDDYEDAPV